MQSATRFCIFFYLYFLNCNPYNVVGAVSSVVFCQSDILLSRMSSHFPVYTLNCRPYYAIQCWTQDASILGQGGIFPPGVLIHIPNCTYWLETKRLTRLSLEYFSTERKSCFKLALSTACLINRY